ncbi:MAG: TlpA disulfide reductase family protein, partial [Planctomycetota bacterium]|nr:TlpA disulfide reductase family protein [Planctomycetota bacterium]
PLVAAARIGIALHKLQEISRGKIASVEAILAMRAEVEELAKQLESQDEKLAQYATQIRNLLAAERVGLEAYGIEGIDVQGKEFALKEYQGKVVLLDFFVDWCPWCKRMYEHNRDLVTHYANRPFAILGVNADNQQILERLTNDATVTWRCWADGQGGPISEKWQVDSYPNLVLVDHRGIVRRRFRGSPGQQELDQAIEQLVGEAESDTLNP